MNFSKACILVCIFSAAAVCQGGERAGLQSEIFLHPGDGFTAYTLRKNEVLYCQSPMTLPLPSWAWWGITDRLTAEIDLLPLIGGLFIEPHWPVPSFNFRYRLREAKGKVPAMAFETMYQHLWRTIKQLDDTVVVTARKGNSWYNRVNFSWQPGRHLRLHVSPGLTYSENLSIRSGDSANPRGNEYHNRITPDFSVSLDYRPWPRFSVHSAASYGTTFVYVDNVPRKYQVSYGFRTAPFYNFRYAFLRNFRAEFISLYMVFPDAGRSLNTYLPVFPYFYWQWKI